ncbi:hypothetical protein N9045_01990 [bacterium]|nr:hypothetical protein [bacterium]
MQTIKPQDQYYETYCEQLAWQTTKTKHQWIFNKLTIAQTANIIAGPNGIPVPKPGKYIVRPIINPLGLGLQTQTIHIQNTTDHLPISHFWSSILKGKHLSIDYTWGKPTLTIQGTKRNKNNHTQWKQWKKVKLTKHPKIPKPIYKIIKKYPQSNCEFINGTIIEVHLRSNPDFIYNNKYYVPIYEHDNIQQMKEKYPKYQIIKTPYSQDRIAALIK